MSECEVTRPVLRYHGGKWMLAPWIISQFPPHRIYAEPFGGAASVLLRKPRSYAEVYNDLDGEIVNLFRVVRDRGDELMRAIALTPYAREEFELAWYPAPADELEQARRTVVRSFMGFASAAVTMKRHVDKSRGVNAATGFRENSNRSGTTPAHDWRHLAATGFRNYTQETATRQGRWAIPSGDWSNYDSSLSAVIDRLRGVVIENRNALQLIPEHDGERTLFYVDPPYVPATRDKGTDYQHEMTEDDHRALAVVLRDVRGMVVLSGYHCDLYDELFGDWHRVQRASLADGARARTEVLWMNTAAVRRMPQPTLYPEAAPCAD